VTERDSDSLLPMLTSDVEHVVRFTPSWRGYARTEVDAFVTRSERELAALRARVEDLEIALHETESRHGETAADAARWRALYEDSVPPFEELGTRVAEILGLADAEARERVRAAEEQAAAILGEAGARAAALVTEAEERASTRESEAEERVSLREARLEERESQAEQQAADTIASAERRAAELAGAAEEQAAARETESAERVQRLEQEHASLVERLSGIRDVLSQLPGLGTVAAAGLEQVAGESGPVGATGDADATLLAAPVTDDEAAGTEAEAEAAGTEAEAESGEDPRDPDATVVGAVPAVDETQVQQVVAEARSGKPRR
jgi:DivIVA domain-containing protein